MFYSAMAVGFLAKGPVAIALPVLTLLLYRFAFWRRPLPWRRLRPEFGVLEMLLIIGAWGIPALLRTHGEFYRAGIGYHVINRGLTPFEGHGSLVPYYYLVTGGFSLFRWICFGGAVVTAVRRQWNIRNAFLVSWVAGTYLLFTDYLTKLPLYVLPAFPALMLLLGQAAQPGLKTGRRATVWVWAMLTVALAMGAMMLVGAIVWKPVGLLGGLRGAMFGAAGVIFSLAALALLWRNGRVVWLWLPLATLGLSTLVLSLSVRLTSPSLRVRELAESLPAEAKCASYRYGEPSLVFYTNRRWIELEDPGMVAAFLAEAGPRLVVYYRGDVPLDDVLKKLLGKKPRASDSTFPPVPDEANVRSLDIEGFNMARASWVTLRLYYRADATTR